MNQHSIVVDWESEHPVHPKCNFQESLEAYSSGDRGSIECSLDRREEAIDKDEA